MSRATTKGRGWASAEHIRKVFYIESGCRLGRCPMYKGDCINKEKCLAEELGLIGTCWDHPVGAKLKESK
jgi:hypothetical protein